MKMKKTNMKMAMILCGFLVIGSLFTSKSESQTKVIWGNSEAPTKEVSPKHEERKYLTPYGIELGKTTIDEIKKKFTLLNRESGRLGKIYKLDPKDFNIGDLQATSVFVYTVLGESEDTVQNIEVSFSGKCFSRLKEILSKKYYIDEIKEKFVGDQYCKFKDSQISDQWIYLSEPHMSFETMIIYRTAKFEGARDDALSKTEQKNNADMEAKL